MNFGSRGFDFGSWICSFFFRLDFGSCDFFRCLILEFGYWNLDFGLWIWDLGSCVCVCVCFFKVRFWILVRVFFWGFGFRILNLGVWILGLAFWILEFGFLILVRVFFFEVGF